MIFLYHVDIFRIYFDVFSWVFSSPYVSLVLMFPSPASQSLDLPRSPAWHSPFQWHHWAPPQSRNRRRDRKCGLASANLSQSPSEVCAISMDISMDLSTRCAMMCHDISVEHLSKSGGLLKIGFVIAAQACVKSSAWRTNTVWAYELAMTPMHHQCITNALAALSACLPLTNFCYQHLLPVTNTVLQACMCYGD